MALIGILIIIIGFALQLDTIAVVVSAGIVTGLVADMSINEILTTLGTTFINNRTMVLFTLTLPVIGLCERYGLKAKATMLIEKVKGISTGRFLSGYTLLREISISMGVTIGGHPLFVSPLISPMSLSASEAKYGKLDENDEDLIKGYAAASDNIGNFFGQNVFIANSGVLLIVGTLSTAGYDIDNLAIAKASIPIAIIAFLLWILQNYLLDIRLKRKYSNKNK